VRALLRARDNIAYTFVLPQLEMEKAFIRSDTNGANT